jgi:hypothetical protein
MKTLVIALIISLSTVAVAQSTTTLDPTQRIAIDKAMQADRPQDANCPNAGANGVCIQFKCYPWVADSDGQHIDDNININTPCQLAGDGCQNGFCPIQDPSLAFDGVALLAHDYCNGQLGLPPLPSLVTAYCYQQYFAGFYLFCQGDTGSDPTNGGEK